MWRRSISCMLAGLMIAAAIAFFTYPGEWYPHKWLVIAAISVGVIGIMWLYDEITETGRTAGPR